MVVARLETIVISIVPFWMAVSPRTTGCCSDDHQGRGDALTSAAPQSYSTVSRSCELPGFREADGARLLRASSSAEGAERHVRFGGGQPYVGDGVGVIAGRAHSVGPRDLSNGITSA
jgi:hypothetical protein